MEIENSTDQADEKRAVDGDAVELREALARLETRLTKTSRIYKTTLELADQIFPVSAEDLEAIQP